MSWLVTIGGVAALVFWLWLATRSLRASNVAAPTALLVGPITLVGHVVATKPVEKGEAFEVRLDDGRSIPVVPSRRARIATRGARSWEAGTLAPEDLVRVEGLLVGTASEAYREAAWSLDAFEITHLARDPRTRSRVGPAVSLALGVLALAWLALSVAPFVALSLAGREAMATAEVVSTADREGLVLMGETEHLRFWAAGPNAALPMRAQVTVEGADPTLTFIDDVGVRRLEQIRERHQVSVVVAELLGVVFGQVGDEPGVRPSTARSLAVLLVCAASGFALFRRRARA